jgi:tetratricopeptide (TPR) repeat protein
LYDKNASAATNKPITTVLHQKGMLLQIKGQYNDAFRLYGKSLEISEKLGDSSRIASTLHQIGMIYAKSGDHDKALELYNKSLQMSELRQNQLDIADNLVEIGAILIQRGSYIKALAYTYRAYLKYEKIDSPYVDLCVPNLEVIKNAVGSAEYEKALNELRENPRDL